MTTFRRYKICVRFVASLRLWEFHLMAFAVKRFQVFLSSSPFPDECLGKPFMMSLTTGTPSHRISWQPKWNHELRTFVFLADRNRIEVDWVAKFPGLPRTKWHQMECKWLIHFANVSSHKLMRGPEWEWVGRPKITSSTLAVPLSQGKYLSQHSVDVSVWGVVGGQTSWKTSNNKCSAGNTWLPSWIHHRITES